MLRLLAAVLLLQTVLAPAVCLAMGGGSGSPAVQICTADGLRVIHPSAPGDEAPAGSGHGGNCLVCHALPQGAALALPALPAPAWLAVAATHVPAEPATLPRGIRGPPGGARAPPAFS